MAAEIDGGTPRQARDVMAFGQEVGRVLSDGAVVGRAEPFAKVFASSRVVKRAVGLAAWGVLEDIALDAHLDAEGRLVAETSVREIAANLGVNKETVARHLSRLRDHGFVLHEEIRQQDSGRYETARYVLDPAACLERFTHTPAAPADGPCTENPHTGSPVSGFSVHGESVHGSLDIDVVVGVEEQQQAQQTFAGELQRLGIDADTAVALASEHGDERVAEVVAAVRRTCPRNPAGWAIAALTRGWALSPTPRPSGPRSPARARAEALAEPDPGEIEAEEARAQRWRDWDVAVSAAVDDDVLVAAIQLACRPAYGNRWVVPAIQVELIRWAAAVYARTAGGDLAAALTAAIDQRWYDVDPPTSDDLPIPAPPAFETAAALRARIDTLLPRLDPHRDTDADPPVSQPHPTPGGLP